MTVIAPNPAHVLSAEMPPPERTLLHIALNFCRRKPLGVIGLAIVLVIIAAGLVSPTGSRRSTPRKTTSAR